MANTTAVYARIDTELKKNAEEVLSKLGITPSSAIQMLYSQIILTNSFPFQPKIPDYRFTANFEGKDKDIEIEMNRPSSFTNSLDDPAYDLHNTLDAVKESIIREVPAMMGDDCRRIILYGSCARGDFNMDSDVDIAILTQNDRLENKKYNGRIDSIAADIAVKTMAVVNFVFLPFDEFMEKKSWYLFFKNIDRDGVVLYES